MHGYPASLSNIIAYALCLNHSDTKLCNACPGCVSWLSTNVTAFDGFSFTNVCSSICDKS